MKRIEAYMVGILLALVPGRVRPVGQRVVLEGRAGAGPRPGPRDGSHGRGGHAASADGVPRRPNARRTRQRGATALDDPATHNAGDDRRSLKLTDTRPVLRVLRLRTNTSARLLVSPVTRFEAADAKATPWPSAEMAECVMPSTATAVRTARRGSGIAACAPPAGSRRCPERCRARRLSRCRGSTPGWPPLWRTPFRGWPEAW